MKFLLVLLVLLSACRPPMLRLLASPTVFDLVKEESKLLNEEAGCKWIDEEFNVDTDHRDIIVQALPYEELILQCGDPAWGCFQYDVDDIYMIDQLNWKEYFKPNEDRAMRLVFLHELGHAMGLPHSTDTADIMFKSTHLDLAPATARQQLVKEMLRRGYQLCQYPELLPPNE